MARALPAALPQRSRRSCSPARRTAELIKYAANAFLATKITFINEIADLCEKVGADVQEVARGIGLDNRIGAKFLHAGPGYGGSCFPKDTLALVKTAQDARRAAAHRRDGGRGQRRSASAPWPRKVIAACGGSVRGKTIAVLGLTFKPNTDDMRDAPSLAIVTALQDAGAQVRAYDPEGMDAGAPLMPTDVTYAHDNAYACARGRRRARHRHRMGRVPRARPRPRARSLLKQPRRRRPAQHLPARRTCASAASPMSSVGRS